MCQQISGSPTSRFDLIQISSLCPATPPTQITIANYCMALGYGQSSSLSPRSLPMVRYGMAEVKPQLEHLVVSFFFFSWQRLLVHRLQESNRRGFRTGIGTGSGWCGCKTLGGLGPEGEEHHGSHELLWAVYRGDHALSPCPHEDQRQRSGAGGRGCFVEPTLRGSPCCSTQMLGMCAFIHS